jgi:hypothetical protein
MNIAHVLAAEPGGIVASGSSLAVWIAIIFVFFLVVIVVSGRNAK